MHHPFVGITSLDELGRLFAGHGVHRVYTKWLSAKQDNDKNQVYLATRPNGLFNLFPASVVARPRSQSIAKRNSSKGRPKIEALLDFYWLAATGTLHAAPNARLIDYFQYPEVRLSGFLSGCSNPPDALRRVNQAKYGRRILVLGVTSDEKTIGYVLTDLNDPLVGQFPDPLPSLPFARSLGILSFAAPTVNPEKLLIEDLKFVCDSGWVPSVKLGAASANPRPFSGPQGAGYTLEALLGIPANAKKAPDKHGYEIKTYKRSGKVSLMTPTADGGYEGRNDFRSFMGRYGFPGTANDGRSVFSGVYRCDKPNKKTGYVLRLKGYDSKTEEFCSDTENICVEIVDEKKGRVLSRWSFEKLANGWSKKHALACYVQREERTNPDSRHGKDYCYQRQVYLCEGTDIWRFLRAIKAGIVFYDPGHAIYANGKTKVRPQWRVSLSQLDQWLDALYDRVVKVIV